MFAFLSVWAIMRLQLCPTANSIHSIIIMLTGVVDNSGFRLWVTPNLREHDAGVMRTGIMVRGKYGYIIPPHFPELHHRGYCTADCISGVH